MEQPRSNTGKTITGISMALGIFIIICLNLILARPPRVVPGDAAENAFSAERAARHLPGIATERSPIGTPAHQRVQQYIISQLEQLGLTPQVHETQYLNTMVQQAAGIKNILVRLPGTGQGDAIIIVGHYDTVIDAYGASDNGSAVVTMLELARLLRYHPVLKNDLIFLFSDAEEVGLLGVQAFLSEHEWVNDIRLVLNLEARGSTGQSIMFETGDNNLEMVREFAKAVPFPVGTSLSGEIYKFMPNYTDFTAFKVHGFQGLNFAYIDNSFDYHTGGDNIENTDLRSIQHHGSYVQNLVLHLGNIPLDFQSDKDAVYFNAFGYGFVTYSCAMVRPLAVIVVLLALAIIVLGVLRHRFTLRGMLAGLVDSLVLLFMLFVVFSNLIRFVSSFYPGMDIRLLYYNQQGILLGFSLMTVALCTIYYFMILRGMRKSLLVFPALALLLMIMSGDVIIWMALVLTGVAIWLFFGHKNPAHLWSLTSGTLIIWIILTMGVSFMVPGASYLFTWPLLGALLPLGFVVYKDFHQGPLMILLLLVFTIPALVLYPELAVLFHLAMGLPMLGITMVVLGLMMSLLIPHVYLMTPGKLWILPAVVFALALFILPGQIVGLEYNQRHRKINNIMHITQGQTGESFWVSLDKTPDEWTSLFLTHQPDTMPFSEFFPINTTRAWVFPAQPSTMAMPQLSVLADSVGLTHRMIRIQVRVPRDASRMVFLFDTGESSLHISLNEQRHTMRPLTAPDKRRMGIQGPVNLMMLPYYAPPEDIILTLYTNPDQPIGIHISAHNDTGIPEFPGYSPRPDFMMGRGDMTMTRMDFTF